MYQLSEWYLSESNGDVIVGYADGIPPMGNVPVKQAALMRDNNMTICKPRDTKKIDMKIEETET